MMARIPNSAMSNELGSGIGRISNELTTPCNIGPGLERLSRLRNAWSKLCSPRPIGIESSVNSVSPKVHSLKLATNRAL